MGIPSILSLFLLLHLLFLHSSGKCPDSFNCGTHGQLSFPLSNTTYPQCGLYTVQNCTDPFPKLNLTVPKQPFYDLISTNVKENSIWVNDPHLENLIKTNNCDIFDSYLNRSLRAQASISFTISPGLTLFKCTTISPGLDKQQDSYFRGNDSYRGCSGYTVYYKYPHHYPVQSYGNFSPNCSVIELPVASKLGNRNASDLFSVLASKFSIGFHVSNACHECRSKGGKCTGDRWRFSCFKEKEGHLGLILGTVIPGVILFACLLILIIRYHKKWRSFFSSYTISRNSSSDPFSKEDLEEGSIYFGISVFPYSELNEATHNFDPSKELGDGGFGTVYHGKLQDGREVAVKRLYQHNYKRVAQFLNEIEILTHLRHPNLVTLYGCTSCHSRELLLVYEYIPNGTVADHLHSDRAKDHPLPWPIRMNIAIETASALVYLHASEIIHRDVKTNNILLDNNFCVKVADFGLSRLFPIDVSHVSTAPQGTPGYVDPDYHQCYQLTDKSDVYSFGVVLIELISSLPAVDISRHRLEINLANLAISRIQDGAFNELIDPSLGFNSDASLERMTTSVAQVAFRCLQLEKEMRPRMNEVLDALKKIQEYNDEEIGKMPPPSPDGDNVELLNSSKVPPSQDSVTDRWFSSSAASISSV